MLKEEANKNTDDLIKMLNLTVVYPFNLYVNETMFGKITAQIFLNLMYNNITFTTKIFDSIFIVI